MVARNDNPRGLRILATRRPAATIRWLTCVVRRSMPRDLIVQ